MFYLDQDYITTNAAFFSTNQIPDILYVGDKSM